MDSQRSPFVVETLTVMLFLMLFLAGGMAAGAQPPSATVRGDSVSESDATELAAMARAATDDFQPLPDDHVHEARERLERAIERLDRFLSTGTQRNEANWKAYLQWPGMLSELQRTEGPRPRELGRILGRYYRNYTSLGQPAFTRARAALLRYRNALVMVGDQQLASRYKTQLQKLAEQLEAYQQAPTMERRRAIGGLVRWLETAGQAERLVALIRDRYQQPNLYAGVSEHLANASVGRDIAETDVVQDWILGTLVFSTATLRGRTEVDLIESPDDACLHLFLSGVTDSDSVGYNRGVKIFSDNRTTVDARKAVRLDAGGFSFAPSRVQCDTESSVTGIAAGSRLVQRIAWRRVCRLDSRSEQIASRRAAARIGKRMDEEADELLREANDTYQDRFRKPLLRRGEYPRQLRFSTSDDRLHVVWCQANASQLAAPNKPQPIEGENDLQLQLHESFVSNFSRAMLGGLRLADKRLVELLRQNALEVPETVQLSDDKEPWAITFSSREPVSVVFSGNTVRFAIRGRRFELGERVVRKELEMSAVYDVEKTPRGAHFTRQGDVSVEYVNAEGRLSAEEVVVRTVTRKKFEALFAPEFDTTGIKLPGRWAKGGMLHLEDIRACGSWLNLAWTQRSDRPADPESSN